MFITMFKAKIHRATVTEANLNYMGSITIDQALLEAAGIFPHEKVQIVDNNNGARFETYVIAGPRDSGVICLNGAAARLVQPGDTVIIIAYTMLTPEEAAGFQPTVLLVDEKNRVTEVRHGEAPGERG
ncbi:aspartate 1-decarboxylase [Desulfotomaculum copahuensis]|uniref:Aspartate 1-decarboxylase n=1 Tax=Desulfotomaculum copahuensis TaxID=1838280 RepID=A0A1B7LCP0_9FIRM|nr:aspartate 1-decarboxylase [Desulfotomaculum copahuensis]OAT80695.1 aspartate 1-decarboxylase [Desulfotomaculum copahuensis]